jgi:hypothetical protein
MAHQEQIVSVREHDDDHHHGDAKWHPEIVRRIDYRPDVYLFLFHAHDSLLLSQPKGLGHMRAWPETRATAISQAWRCAVYSGTRAWMLGVFPGANVAVGFSSFAPSERSSATVSGYGVGDSALNTFG